ncbi:MAG: hypothetical protein CM15mP62_31430 [Rhodospirillaceae bacterium]|nr:MAG: hypothetical protein CM15mP62_31430 [Rhodospirillaceae bacterium]
MNHLDTLESQSIFILREAFAKFQNLGLLWSLGKDSNVMDGYKKTFFGNIPFPLLFCVRARNFPKCINSKSVTPKGVEFKFNRAELSTT